MPGMLSDEGISNSFRVFWKYLTDSPVRGKMKRMNQFFNDNKEYFVYGIYVDRKPV